MRLLDELNVNLTWIKGHNNNTGNEFADMLARKGAEDARNLSYTSPFLPVSYGALKSTLRDCFLSMWQSIWDQKVDCNISHQILPETRSNLIHRVSLGANKLQELSQIVTGHGLFKRHLRHWNEIQDISCVLCGEADEDPWHLWALCPALEGERKSSLHQMRCGLLEERTILRFFHTPALKRLMADGL